MDARPTTSSFGQDEATQLLDKDRSSPKCLERHRCTLISAALLLTLGASLLVHSAVHPRTFGSRSFLVLLGMDRPTFLLEEKPLSDQRTYQFSTLDNGLQVLNIEDSQSRKMAMAMAVRAGSYDDPRELPGLAHFCEHMLFLGTKKYPEPSGFDQFMTKYGGSNNAYTSSEATVYFAAASAEAAPEGLDRFADFFRAPLFKKEFVKKEVQAINSEHEKNVQSNVRRIFELLEQQANPDSVVGRFATGNMETLYNRPSRNGTSPVDALKVYFKEHYCPQQMRLVTFGPQKLSEQLELVTKAGFQDLPKGEKSCYESGRRFEEPNPFPASQMGKSLLMKGTEAIGSLWLHFQLPPLEREFKAQPLTYLNYVVNYGGENSLKRVLSDHLGLVADVQMEEQTDSTGTMCMVVFETTKLGLKHSQAILDVFFAYLAAIRSAGVNMELYKSIQDMVKLKWDWKQTDDAFETVSNLAEVMTRMPREKILSGDSLIMKPDSELLTSLIDRVEPSNMNIAQVAPSTIGDKLLNASGQKIRTLEYYGAKFVEQTVAEAFPHLKLWSSWMKGIDNKQMVQELKESLKAVGMDAGDVQLPPRLPGKIEGIPEHVPLDHMMPPKRLTRIRGSEPSQTEKLFGPLPVRLSLDLPADKTMVMMETPNGSKEDVWFRSGWTMKDPKVHLAVGLRRLQTELEPEATALDSVRFHVYQQLLSEDMAPKLFDLTAAGSTYGVNAGFGGLTLDFVGYEEALPKLIDKVLESFNSFNEHINATHSRRFKRIVGTYMEELMTHGGMPSSYASQDMERLLVRNRFSNEESLEAVKQLSLEKAVRTVGELVLSRQLQMTALAIGNVADLQSTDSLREIASLVKRPTWVTPRPAGKNAAVEEVMPVVQVKRPVEVRSPNPRPGDPNDVAVVSLLYGVSDIPSRCILSIASSLLGTAAFDNLRTQQQLGYVVGGGMSSISNVLLMRVVVQGTKVNADEAEAAIEGLLTSTMPKILNELTDAGFQRQVESFKQQLLEPPLAATDEVSHFWGHMTQGGRCMDLLDKVLKFIQSPQCNKELLQNTWNELVFSKSGKEGASLSRKKISVKYFASEAQTEAPQRITLKEAQELWKKHGVAPKAMSLLAKEWEETKVLAKSDSKERKELIEEGGYFPTDLHCGALDPSDDSSETVMRKATKFIGGDAILHGQGTGKSKWFK